MKRAALFALLLLALVTTALADDAPRARVRVRIEPAGPVAVGETVRLVVDALVTTWLAAGLELPALRIPGAVVTESDEHAPHLTETIDGATWFGVSRVYLVTPTAPGELAVPAIPLSVHPGGAPAALAIATAPLTLTVTAPVRPPGAEHALAASKLTLTQHLDRTLDGLRVGDSLTRTVAITADGARGMFLPPTTFAPIAGLAVYPSEPHVDDVTDRQGEFMGGRRIDAATYVVQAAGTHTLPAVRVAWWDTKARKLQTATVPAITFDAAANPAAKPELALPADEAAEDLARFGRPTLVALALLAIGVATWLVVPRIGAARRRLVTARAERRRREEASEPWAFARVTDGLRANDPTAVYPAVVRWLARMAPDGPPITLDTLGARSDDPVLGRQLATLAAALYTDDARAPHWTAGDLEHRLTDARHRLRRNHDTDAAAPALPPLNPV